MSLDRFVEAQRDSFATALSEIEAGQKRSHWMWYIWPQLRGLGHSQMAQHYGIADAAEARAYLAHPTLGPRLVEISRAMLAHRGRAPEDILGGIDALKLRSSATLFAAQPGADPVFGEILEAFYDGPDDRTLALLDR
ncbi:uncharacterized protein (DUF1810 family) [Limimaricola soesokkakensis]|uniref:Uncharacterized protein (DUF1810 family) n=1 Tax=Limimaricola soesokkakensis TaxID=1343159 RepID=A0A1X6YPQ4_9RHOB|nr:DUF1810 domain-containing protein [Limimaricola soesokkakensis]PSK88294.1 uncharacterized protein (DUF1810 family) [Limimaricola soesokkakensis]SLN27061.1 hypothetical protein LOS8367_00957 [Limimaricola soesokkakensis]